MYPQLQSVANKLDYLAELTGRTIAWLTLAMVLIMFTVVVLRYLFNSGSIALQESISYLHASVFMLGAAWTLKEDGHVRVDIFYSKLNHRARAWINLIGTLLLLLPVCGFIFYSSLDYVALSWSIREGSQETGGLNAVYLLKTAIPLMAVLLILQGCANILKSIVVIGGHSQVEKADLS